MEIKAHQESQHPFSAYNSAIDPSRVVELGARPAPSLAACRSLERRFGVNAHRTQLQLSPWSCPCPPLQQTP